MPGSRFDCLPGHPLLSPVIHIIQAQPAAIAITILITTLLITRIYSQTPQVYRSSNASLKTTSIPRQKYYLPILRSSPMFLFSTQSQLFSTTPYVLTLFSGDHIIITSQQLLSQLSQTTSRPYHNLRSRHFFANSSITPLTSSRITTAITTYLTNPRLSRLTSLLSHTTTTLVSSATSWVDQSQWERNGDVTLLTISPLTVSARLTTLLREFSATTLLATLLGTSFTAANQNFATDFLSFSEAHARFMLGFPYILIPGLSQPAFSREKCLRSIDGLVATVISEIEGTPTSGIGMLYDIDGIDDAIIELIRAAYKDTKRRAISSEILEMVWRVVYYQTNLVFWMVVYLSSDSSGAREAMKGVREEIQRLVRIEKPEPSGLAFEEAPSVRVVGKMEGCVMLRACFREVVRLETEMEEYFEMEGDFVVEDTERWELRKGDRVYAAYGGERFDEKKWRKARSFLPERWVENGKLREEMVGGMEELAEKVLILVAALLMYYEFRGSDGRMGVDVPGSSIVAGMGCAKGFTNGVVKVRQ